MKLPLDNGLIKVLLLTLKYCSPSVHHLWGEKILYKVRNAIFRQFLAKC